MTGWFADRVTFLRKGQAIKHWFFTETHAQCGYAVFKKSEKIKLPNSRKCKRCVTGNRRRGVVG